MVSSAPGSSRLASPRSLVPMLGILLLAPSSAAADVHDYVGKRVVDVRVDVSGEVVDDPDLLELVETRVGEALSMVRVRETIDHLTGLGRFEDVRVYARPAPDGGEDGVMLQWTLIAVERVARVSFAGSPGFPEDQLRTAIEERGERRVPVARVASIVERLRVFYEERGFRSPQITHRILVGRTPEGAELEFTVHPGPRTTITDLRLETPSDLSEQEVLARLRVGRGQVYDRPELERRAAEYEERLRDRGYYEAAVEHVARFSETSAGVTLVVTVDPGPLVRVTFAGDPLPEDVRDELVSIRQERSVDEDLLEDSSRNIRRYLRDAGYRDAAVRSERSEQGGELLVTFTIQRGLVHRVSDVRWAGVSALAQTELTRLAPLAPQDVFVDERVATMASAATELYQVRGFAAASVDVSPSVGDAVSGAGETFRPVAVQFDVREGRRMLVREVAVNGATSLAEDRIRAVLGLQSGRPFYRPQLTADRDALEELYRNEGFAQVSVAAEPGLVEGGEAVDVRWTVREGPQTRVDHVLVTGNVRTSAALIRRELALVPGQPLGEDARVESQRKLAALGLFRRVRITEVPHGVGPDRDVLIEVEEAPGSTVAYGGGLEVGQRLRRTSGGTADERLEFAPRAFFEIGRQNLGGKNRALNFFTRASLRSRDAGVNEDPQDVPGGYGLNEYRAVGTFREPRVFDTTGDAQLTGFVEQAIRSSFSFRRLGVRAEYARRITQSFTVSGRYTLDRTRLYNAQIPAADQPDIDRLFPQVRLSTMTGSLLRDSRDDVLDPQRGTVMGVDGSVAARGLGSEVGFVRSFLQLFSYRRLPGASRFVLVAGARLGLSKGFARDVSEDGGEHDEPSAGLRVTDLPASERFFAGGDTTVRGFALDRLGTDETLNAQGFPTGGSGLLVFNLEVRAPYWKGVGPVGFLDAGNVFRRANDVDLSELRGAAGFGIRYLSPIGPLRVDVGFKLDPRTLQTGARERRAIFHISLGQAF